MMASTIRSCFLGLRVTWSSVAESQLTCVGMRFSLCLVLELTADSHHDVGVGREDHACREVASVARQDDTRRQDDRREKSVQ
jgi:hypothetical protein